jgi:hypothetical protein
MYYIERLYPGIRDLAEKTQPEIEKLVKDPAGSVIQKTSPGNQPVLNIGGRDIAWASEADLTTFLSEIINTLPQFRALAQEQVKGYEDCKPLLRTFTESAVPFLEKIHTTERLAGRCRKEELLPIPIAGEILNSSPYDIQLYRLALTCSGEGSYTISATMTGLLIF